jgi:ankyrin repeat protein
VATVENGPSNATGAGCGIALMVAFLAVLVLGSMLHGCDFGSTARGPDRFDCANSKRRLIASTAEVDGAKTRKYLAAGDSPNARDHDGNRALPCAALSGNADAVRALLDGGADPNLTGNAGGRPVVGAISGEGLHEAPDSEGGVEPAFAHVMSPQRILIIGLLAQRGVPLEPALSPAVEQDNLAAIRLLLDKGADPNGAPDQPSPLTMAAINACEQTTILSSHSCDDTANTKIFDLLLARGANLDRGGTIDGTRAGIVLSLASRPSPHSSKCTPSSPSLEARDGEVPPLVAAALARDQHALGALLAAGADPNRLAFDWYSPLWAAVYVHDPATVKLLVGAGADPDPAQSASPLDMARKSCQRGIARTLTAAAKSHH